MHKATTILATVLCIMFSSFDAIAQPTARVQGAYAGSDPQLDEVDVYFSMN